MVVGTESKMLSRRTALTVVTSLPNVTACVYLFARPYGFEIVDAQSAVALGTFLLMAAVVRQLSARLRRTALESARLSREQSALREVATLVARSARSSTVFDAVTREVGLLCGADLVGMARYETHGTVRGVASWIRPGGPDPLVVGTRPVLDGPGLAREVRRTCDPVRVEDFAGAVGPIVQEARAVGIRSSVGYPILVAGHLWGVIIASKTSDGPFPANAESQIAAFTDLVAIAIENARTDAELTASRARIVTAADGERRRIERDLHDGVQQRLVSLLLLLRNAQLTVPPQLGALRAELHHVAVGLTDAFDDLREVAHGIHPAILAQGGLAPALKALARRSALPVDVAVHVRERLPEQVEVSAYYVVSEALTNAVKHAQASTVTVTVDADSEVLRVRVEDDGVGGADFAAGTGLVGLKDRVEALDGRMFLDSPRTAGTTLSAELPFVPNDRARRSQTAGRAAEGGRLRSRPPRRWIYHPQPPSPPPSRPQPPQSPPSPPPWPPWPP
ncbi:GAF domain-containing protein [Streptomyces sp. Ag109_G2-15]|uniref:sensor histidine kinase n=1 Tax=Streptomyces sp. Ag109_G2-15 TaxID=1938850 RepID=UPI000BC75147|nr:GAF domain-containing protein [Streptomyces sp. Ag109_G2-15]SOE06748.1 Histidine kinase-, DNA gyrase B-, and HSP90-like ATPase [Streptomyces sp. Ag109_G2-15]